MEEDGFYSSLTFENELKKIKKDDQNFCGIFGGGI